MLIILKIEAKGTDAVGNESEVASKTTVNTKGEHTIVLEQGAKAIDNIEGDITGKIIATHNIDISKVGEYTITYAVNDCAGNIATVTRKIVVYRPSSSYNAC